MIKRAFLGLSAALAIYATPANAQNLVFNGSFEEGVAPGTYTTLTAGSANITGWTIAGSVDYIGSYWETPFGDRSVDLAGLSLGTISQTILGLTDGQAYTISFYASRNPDGGVPNRTGTISFNGTNETFEYALSNSLGNMNWQLYSYNFIATGTDTFLSFAADASAGCCWGPALDNVSMIAAIPEPEVWAMLLFGFGAIGFQMRRRGGLRTVTA